MEVILPPNDPIISSLFQIDLCNDIKCYVGYLYLLVKYKTLKSPRKLTFISTDIEEIDSFYFSERHRYQEIVLKLFSAILNDNPKILETYRSSSSEDELVEVLKYSNVIWWHEDIMRSKGIIIVIPHLEKEKKNSIETCLICISPIVFENDAVVFVLAGNEKTMKEYITEYEPKLINNENIWFLDL